MFDSETMEDVMNRFSDPLTDDITTDELQQIFFVMYPSNCLRREHFTEAVKTICDDNVCHRLDFQNVLRELIRRMELREMIFWDFELLDGENQGCITLSDARMLFQQTLGATHFEKYWQNFEEKRLKNSSNKNTVSFEEIEIILCAAVPE
uniref:EF-hand domain-containing protein n=1 Tax=Clytia hemisphaerica TaxID=252671 RepID=A0A7M5XF83_9CNID